MKFVAAKCPNCGSKLEFKKGEDVYFCEYCRNTIIFDDGKPDTSDEEKKLTEDRDKIIEQKKIKERSQDAEILRLLASLAGSAVQFERRIKPLLRTVLAIIISLIIFFVVKGIYF